MSIDGASREVASWPEDDPLADGASDERLLPGGTVSPPGRAPRALCRSRCPPSDPMDPSQGDSSSTTSPAQAGLVLATCASPSALVARLDELRPRSSGWSRPRTTSGDGWSGTSTTARSSSSSPSPCRLRLAAHARSSATQRRPRDARPSSRTRRDGARDLRDLARGIYPPLLAAEGLAAALDAQARKSRSPSTVETDGVGRSPAGHRDRHLLLCPRGVPERGEVRRRHAAPRSPSSVPTVTCGSTVARRRYGVRSVGGRARHGAAGHR